MSDETLTRRGLNDGRNWSALPAGEGPLEWSVDPRQGLVQGPLDLGFLRGQKLSLLLEPGQLALLVEEDRVRAVYLDGNHYLDIGTSAGQVPPAGQLVFLAPEGNLALRWPAAEPLRWGPEPHQALIGTCVLDIAGPDAFYRTFVSGAEDASGEARRRLIEQIVRAHFEDRLGAPNAEGRAPNCADVQLRLTQLRAEDLDEELAPCGLSCLHLAVYTAQPPVESADGESREAAHQGARPASGHFDGVGHN